MVLPDPTLPPAVVVHGLRHARAALAVGLPVTLLSGPAAATYAGAAWWRAVMRQSGFTGPDILDCGDAPGRAIQALGTGCRIIVLDPAVPAWTLVAARAAAAGAVVLRARPPALDLASRGADRQLTIWLSTPAAGVTDPAPSAKPPGPS